MKSTDDPAAPPVGPRRCPAPARLDELRSVPVAFEFHVSKAARVRYDFDRALFQTSGNVIIPDFPAARALRQAHERAGGHGALPGSRRPRRRAQRHGPDRRDPPPRRRDLPPHREPQRHGATRVAALTAQLEPDRLDQALVRFVEQFPPLAVLPRRPGSRRPIWPARPRATPTARSRSKSCCCSGWPTSTRRSRPSTSCSTTPTWPSDTAYERADRRPAASSSTASPPFGPDGQIADRVPARRPPLAAPRLAGRAAALHPRRAGAWCWRASCDRLLVSLDVLHEEEVALWMRMHPTPGAGRPAARPRAGRHRERVRALQPGPRLDAAPRADGQEHLRLARPALASSTAARSTASTRSPTRSWTRWRGRGFTGLWLIGLWERSRASQRIKQLCGNPDAVASAYSLHGLRDRRRPGRRGGLPATCATAPGSAASAWPATWCPTTWASTRAG